MKWTSCAQPQIHATVRESLRLCRNPDNRLSVPCKLCLHYPNKNTGGHNGNCVAFSALPASCGLYGPEIRTQLAPRPPGLSLDRQHKFGRNAALGSLEPVPNL